MGSEGKSKRSTKAEISDRVDEIIILRTGGASRAQIVAYAEKKGWGVSVTQIDDYIRQSKREYRRLSKIKVREQAGLAIARLEDLYNKCLRIQDYKACLSIQRELNDLYSLRDLYKEAKKETENANDFAKIFGQMVQSTTGSHEPPGTEEVG